jgi:lipopolysaccharide transport system ATP-binding protein
LLEVGTGFHPELTGRENIYLNGAILGMKRADINRKFDEIVAFSEIETFLDTPVKRYSSGMYVRLAFAVAAHLEPEILVVDEVLAVGDAGFQKKCLGKMSEVTKEGRTILFVSHNMMAVESLCQRVMWINDGRIMQQGQPSQIISQYMQTSYSALTNQVWPDIEKAPGNDQVRLHRVCVQPTTGAMSDSISVNTPFSFEFDYWNLQQEADLYLSLQLYNEQDVVVFDIGRTTEPMWHSGRVPSGLFRDTCYVPANLLNDGMYRVEIVISKDEKPVYTFREALVFEIQDSVEMRGNWYGKWPGVIRPALQWKSEFVADKPEPTIPQKN